MNKFCLVIFILVPLAACHHTTNSAGDPTNSAGASAKKDPMALQDSTSMAALPSLKTLHFDYDKDPACGMPLKYGLEDSATYKGKLYGFCSRECKEAFLKDPAGLTAKIK